MNNFIYYFHGTVIDVCTGEYGHEYIDKMISSVDNGRCSNWTPYDAITADSNLRNQQQQQLQKYAIHAPFIDELEIEIDPQHLRARSSFWQQFWILYKRRTIQMWRDTVKMK